MRQEEFIAQLEKHEELLGENTRRANKVGYAKLLLVLTMGALVFFMFTRGFPQVLLLLGGVGLVGLIALWVYHHRIYEKIGYLKGLIAVNKRHLARISGGWTDFADMGAEFVDVEHPYSGDLDIVGNKSLFQFLNTTHTWYGRQSFAWALLGDADGYVGETHVRQEAITELAQDIEFSNHMEYCFSKIGASSAVCKLAEDMAGGGDFIKSNGVKYLLMVMPFVTVACIAAAAWTRHSGVAIAGVAFAVLQMGLWIATMLKTMGYLKPISRLPYSLGAYAEVIGNITDREFKSQRLNQIKGVFASQAIEAIKELEAIANKVNLRHNAMFWFIANVLLLWDFWCAVLFEQWRHKYASALESWFAALGEFESLMCFAAFPNVCGNTCLPSVAGENTVFAKSLGHPLIQEDARVCNDIHWDNKIIIISGSNMSGKTTFMRTLGLNLVLARAGSYVCAESLDFPLIPVMTSMRIADDLSQGVSTFYAELKRIRGIIALAEKGPVMFFIDEIFRGTNSVDRLSGARTVLSKLHELGAVGTITTHDLELCEVAALLPRIENYNFSEEYRGGEILFDYRIRVGKSTTTNARYLMELVGI